MAVTPEPDAAPACVVGVPRAPVRVDARAPAFTGEDLSGRPARLGSLLSSSSPIALVFLSPNCGSCHALMPDLGRWQTTLQDDLPLHIVTSADREAAVAAAAEHHLTNIVLEHERAISQRYGIAGTPAAVIIAPNGNVASHVASGTIAIEALIRQALREQQRRGNPQPRPATAQPVPAGSLS